MDRRQFMGTVVLALGGTVYSRALKAFIKGNEKPIILRPSFTDQSTNEFSPGQRALLAMATEIIIPTTDTPGAITARVPQFIELICGQWMNDMERDNFKQGMDSIDEASVLAIGVDFALGTSAEQLAVLETLEKQHLDHPWYERTGGSSLEGVAPFIAVLKELTIFGFFMSEVGSTQVLRMDQLPGTFQGDIPLAQEESSWASVPLM